MSLTGKQRRALRALGHHLNPVVQLGREGITDALLDAVNQALLDHELIKLKVGEGSPVDRHEAADELAEKTSSEVAQVLGRTILLFKRRDEKPKIALPGMPLPPEERAESGARGAKKPAAKKPAPKAKPAPKKPVRRAKRDEDVEDELDE